MKPASRLALAVLISALSLNAAEPKGKKMLLQLPPAVRATVEGVVNGGRLVDIERVVENGHVYYEGEAGLAGVRRNFRVAVDGMLVGRQMFQNELPPAVAQTVTAQLGDGQLGEIDWSNDDGDPVFAIEFTRGGVKRSFAVAPDGWLVAREIALEELPVVVRRAVEFELKGVVPKEIQRGDDGLEISYDVTVDVGGQARTLNFSDEGKLTGTQIALNEVPAAALKTLQPRLAGARLVSVSKSVDDDDTYYEAVFVKAGQHHSATVTADGTLASVQLPLAAAPAGVQKTIREQGGFLARLEQVFEDGEEHFQALLRVKGKAVELELKADGSKL